MTKNNNIKTTTKRGKGLYIFWSIVLAIYVVAFLFDNSLAIKSLQETGLTLLKILPIFVLIFVIMVLSNLFLTPELVKKHFGKEAGLKGWFYALLFGILVAGPPYALYPMLRNMKEHGLATKYLAAFLYNRNVKIPLLPAMIYYFGWWYTIIMTILVIIFSVFDGLILEVLVKDNNVVKSSGEQNG